MKIPNRIVPFFVAALVLGTATRALAHDFWIELSSYRPSPGSPVSITLKSGHPPHGEPIPRIATMMPNFVLTGPNGSVPVPGIRGQDPAGRVRIPESGALAVAYVSQPREITLSAEKFTEHLRNEGLEHVLEARRAAGKESGAAREVYTKFAKALLEVDGREAGPPPQVGHILEILPDGDPISPGFDGILTGRVVFRRQSAAGLLVTAFPAGTGEPIRTRTDSEGRFSLSLQKPGLWIIKTVHMEISPDPAHDWASTWATLSFRSQALGQPPPGQ